jgi:hypothetical protein
VAACAAKIGGVLREGPYVELLERALVAVPLGKVAQIGGVSAPSRRGDARGGEKTLDRL